VVFECSPLTHSEKRGRMPGMGFDSVELVIRVENTFGIELPENGQEEN
jgi:hypothetical protein